MDWQRPDIDPTEIARLYSECVRKAPRSVAVWSRVEGSKLHLYTVLDEKMKAETAVYAAERTVLEQFDPELIEFHVYPDKDLLEAFLKDLSPLLQPSDAFRG